MKIEVGFGYCYIVHVDRVGTHLYFRIRISSQTTCKVRKDRSYSRYAFYVKILTQKEILLLLLLLLAFQ